MPLLKLRDSLGSPYELTIANNQKAIYIHREKGINFKHNHAAMKALSADAYLLYMYLITRQGGRVWVLSSQDVFNQTALKRRTYTNALNELQEKKYLIAGPIEDVGNNVATYHMWEAPKHFNMS